MDKYIILKIISNRTERICIRKIDTEKYKSIIDDCTILFDTLDDAKKSLLEEAVVGGYKKRVMDKGINRMSFGDASMLTIAIMGIFIFALGVLVYVFSLLAPKLIN